MNRETYLEEYPKHEGMRENVKKDKNRLHFHIVPPTGWMNDPNGLCQFRGINHIYFQYTPFLAGWGTKLWGNYTTEDWIHFREEEPFLFPDCAWDRDGAYSGSAWVKGDEIHYFYTGNVKLWDQPYDYIMNGREQNTIHVVSRDGVHAGEKQLVLTNDDYPSDMSKHVRDPKIYEKDGHWYMVLGARDCRSEGCVLLFASEDLDRWEYVATVRPEAPFGYLWECPDLFDLDGQTILTACPQGIEQEGCHYQNVYQCGYFPAEFDFERKTFRLGKFRELDEGFDLYAAQTFRDEKGRRILIGWMAVPDSEYSYDATVPFDWIHALTMPRVLTMKDGVLRQEPLEEMKALRINESVCAVKDFGVWKPENCCFEMKTEWERTPGHMELCLREDVSLTYAEGLFTLRMGESGCGRTERTAEVAELRNFTVFSDTSSLEIFINDGETVMTTRVFSRTLDQAVRFAAADAEGTAACYELGSFTFTSHTFPAGK